MRSTLSRFTSEESTFCSFLLFSGPSWGLCSVLGIPGQKECNQGTRGTENCTLRADWRTWGSLVWRSEDLGRGLYSRSLQIFEEQLVVEGVDLFEIC